MSPWADLFSLQIVIFHFSQPPWSKDEVCRVSLQYLGSCSPTWLWTLSAISGIKVEQVLLQVEFVLSCLSIEQEILLLLPYWQWEDWCLQETSWAGVPCPSSPGVCQVVFSDFWCHHYWDMHDIYQWIHDKLVKISQQNHRLYHNRITDCIILKLLHLKNFAIFSYISQLSNTSWLF